MANDKPELTLLPSEHLLDPEKLAQFWERLTGEKVTPEMVAEFKALLEEEVKKLKQ